MLVTRGTLTKRVPLFFPVDVIIFMRQSIYMRLFFIGLSAEKSKKISYKHQVNTDTDFIKILFDFSCDSTIPT